MYTAGDAIKLLGQDPIVVAHRIWERLSDEERVLTEEHYNTRKYSGQERWQRLTQELKQRLQQTQNWDESYAWFCDQLEQEE